VNKTPFYRRRLFYIVVALPTAIVALYLGLLASPRYVSTTKLVVYQESSSPTASLGGASSISASLSGSPSLHGDYLLSSFLLSEKAFQQANPSWLQKNWSQGTGFFDFGGLLQFFQRNMLTLYRYYQSQIGLHVDAKSTVLTMTVDGYTPQFPQQLSKKILAEGQKAITDLGDQSYRQSVDYNEKLVKKQKMALADSIQSLAAAEKSSGLVNYQTLYQSQLSLIGHLMEKEAELTAQLHASLALQPNNPENKIITQEISSIRSKLERLHIRSDRPDSVLASHVGQLQLLQSNVKNAYQLLLSEEATLVKAKESLLAHKYVLSYVSPPSLPQVPSLPDRWWILWVFLISWGVYVVIK
jgi:capsular polysaccharide transport system permease protein